MLELIEAVVRPETMITAAAAVAAFAATLVIVTPLLDRQRLAQRMRDMALERNSMQTARLADLKKEGAGKLRRQSAGLMQRLIDRFGLRAKFESEELKTRLKMAGLRGQAPLVSYIFFRMAAPLLLTVVALFYVFVVLAKLPYPPAAKLAMALAVGFAGFYLPNIILESMIQRRQHAISSSFPDALDMLLICVQAGMSVEAAFGKVATEITGHSLELAEELSLTKAELSYLHERRRAYENFGKRTGLPGTKALATALIQAERYGTAVSQALRVMAKESRDARMSAAEKKAAALPPKLTVPMIIFFLPVLFVVILGPALIQIMKLR